METRKGFWLKTIEEWESSGLKRNEFCTQKGLNVSTFAYWKHRIKKEAVIDKDAPLVKLPLQISANISEIIIDQPHSYRIHSPRGYDSNTLKRLLSDLNEVLR